MNLPNMLAVARLDLMLLWRNRTALFTVVGMPVLFAGMLALFKGEEAAGMDMALYTGTGYLAFFLVFAVFMNLVSVFTARREDLTLKRLRGGMLSDAEVLGGSVLVAGAFYLVQALVLLVLLGTALGGRFPANPLLMAAGLAAGTAVFALLAFALSGLTPNADMAQLTVVPIMFLSMAGSGVMFPLDGLPEAVQQAAGTLPLTPVVETIRTGYFGQDFTAASTPADVGFLDSWAACARSFAVFGVWLYLGIWSARRWFRWEPRHA
ncbi:ABC transporter permease [Spirillospora sp. NPDC047279]|uniref:ABC transporter permease n=1 Tax=Spirillospora sp. NPDC047279 TaxID=3155478 RepID=UPI00340C0C6B